jgi:hypothetical protein
VIPEVVAMESATEEAEVAIPMTTVTEGTTPESEAAEAPGVVLGAQVDVLPGASTEVVLRLPKIQDAASIRSAPMAEVTSTSRGGLELLADNLVNLESMRHAKQWMKVHCCNHSSRIR